MTMPIRELAETAGPATECGCHECKSDKEQDWVHNTNQKHGKRECFRCRNLADTLIVTVSRPEPPVGQVDLICPLETAKGKGSFPVPLPGTGLSQVMGRHQLDPGYTVLQ